LHLSAPEWRYVEERARRLHGRAWCFARVRKFLEGPPGLFVITGAPGTGKTAIAGQLALAAAGRSRSSENPFDADTITAAVFCRAGRMMVMDLAERLSDQLAAVVEPYPQLGGPVAQVRVENVTVVTGDVAPGARVTGVRVGVNEAEDERAFHAAVAAPLARVRAAGYSERIVLLVDALDEAPSAGTTTVAQLLAAIEDVHIIVTTRDDRRVLAQLEDAVDTVDLVADAPGDRDEVLEFVGSALAERGLSRLSAGLGTRIAAQAHRNFLYALYALDAAVAAAGRGNVEVLASEVLPEGGLGGIYRSFLRRLIAGDEARWKERLRPILGAIAVARGDGMTVSDLASLASHTGNRTVSRSEVRDVLKHVDQFLDGQRPDGPFRAYHESFARFLLNPIENSDWLIDRTELESAIVEAFAQHADGWQNASRYARTHLADHAASCGRLDEIATDPDYLVTAEPYHLLAALPAVRSASGGVARRVYQHATQRLAAASTSERAAYLELAALQTGAHDLAAGFGTRATDAPWRATWARWKPPAAHYVAVIHQAESLATGMLDGSAVIITGGQDKTIRRWWLADGSPIGQPIRAHRGWVSALDVVELEGHPVIVSGGWDGELRLWDLRDGSPIGEPMAGHKDRIRGLAVRRLRNRVLALTGAIDDTLRLWDLERGELVLALETDHTSPILGVILDELDGELVAASADEEGAVRVWSLDAGAAAHELRQPDNYAVWALALAYVRGRPTVVAGGDDALVHTWDLTTGAALSAPMEGHTAPIWALAVTELDGRPLVLSGAEDETVRVWDPQEGTSAWPPLIGHEADVRAMALSRAGNDPVIVTSAYDETVRVWDLLAAGTAHSAGDAHDGQVLAMAQGELAGRPAIATTAEDGTVRVWRPKDGRPAIRSPLTGHVGKVASVALVTDRGVTRVLAAGEAEGIFVWDPISCEYEGYVDTADHGAITSLATLPLGVGTLLAWGSMDGTVGIADYTAGHYLAIVGPAEFFTRSVRASHESAFHEETVPSSIAAVAGGRTRGEPFVVSAAGMNVRRWAARDGRQIGGPLASPRAAITALSVDELDGGTVCAAGNWAGNVYLWDVTTGDECGDPIGVGDDPVGAVTLGELRGRRVLAAGSGERLAIVDLRTRARQAVNIGSQIRGIAICEGTVAVAATGGLVGIVVSPTETPPYAPA
jgi:WD40 repeat protein